MKATSFSRNAAAAAAACELDLHVVLPGTELEQNPLSVAAHCRAYGFVCPVGAV